ncbi:TM0106 family RecB-like putative nuclease [Arthrobacter sp. I2-34]|uniref:TM0106 family RecB-like putative nuclease n=1 Tax=Arthrobacter hankyongi TaxID=2904801 RepID=A0ABS9L2P4_9MICC|nr:TM0106 family RecB-like putative nuclease [Arthrobacter hankyongi]MCG2620967.1 TM0106 family RecB-like putative nuclease [Arthrobacter hankyongi]
MFLVDSDIPGADPDLVYTASDLVAAAGCEYQVLRRLDEKLGRSPVAQFPVDALLARAAELGDVHEQQVLQQFRDRFGAGVVEIRPTPDYTRQALAARHDESLAALRAGADVVFQASFFDGTFHGRSDFLVREAEGGRYTVYDTKLARHVKPTALLQLAAYGQQLIQSGVPTSPTVCLVLGDGTHSEHNLAELLPDFTARRDRFLELTTEHRNQEQPVRWGDARYTACGRCDYCAEQVREHRDLLLVARMSLARRRKLNEAGIGTIDDLAGMELPAGMAADRVLAGLRDQARMQTGLQRPDGAATFTDRHGQPHTVGYRVLPGNTLAALAPPDPGDIFFDIESDPLWQDESGTWGLEYLFGVVENPATPGGTAPYTPFWAHSRAEEGRALAGFLAYVARRRRKFPRLRIYHYANYEQAALRRLSRQHGIGQDAVEELLGEGVLVDLFDTVRTSLLVSENSYSIKKLEPLYMGSRLRTGDVTDAGASMVAYAGYCRARETGNTGDADRILAGIRSYNEYDCHSTRQLRNWLLKLAARPEG